LIVKNEDKQMTI